MSSTGEEKKKKPLSFMYRVQQSLITLSAGSAKTREIIGRLIGEDGNLILSAMKSASVRDVGEVKSEMYMSSVSYLCARLHLMYSNNIVTATGNPNHPNHPENSCITFRTTHLLPTSSFPDIYLSLSLSLSFMNIVLHDKYSHL